ncbi:MAG: tetratricopeptide repeat protein [Candidatus Omnitrophica bacterium]|nr:tetratricopeptide repeat protein [Candidatus Omnitrophota bacterium]
MRRQVVLSGSIIFVLFFSLSTAERALCENIKTFKDFNIIAAKFDYKSTLSWIQECIKEKDYLKARELCDSLLRYSRGNSQILYLRAALSQKIGQQDQAIDDYNVLIRRNLADAKVFNNLAALYAFKEDFSRAIELLSRAIKEDPGSVEAHNNLADAFMRIQDYGRALEEYNKVIVFEPGNTTALYNLGFLYAKNKDYAKAKQSWEKVLSINPKDPDAQKAVQNFNKLN